ncbi:MAG: TIGR02266 family protein [Proteobacteria bacterium]|jgi:uncharacterized protein (TIGR02266 family)|nr:TIGR02266 family protein [Pseudomonadota bacterium]
MANPIDKGSSIRAKLKFPDVASFVERYAPNVSTAGIFVKTPSPKPVGTRVKFEFLIADGTVVMRGLGQVAWVRESAADDRPVGMGIKFVKLDAASRGVLDRIIDFKHSLDGPPVPSRYSEVPPPYVPEGTDVDEGGGAEALPEPAEEAPRESPPPPPPPPPAPEPEPVKAIVPPPAEEQPPEAAAAPRKKHRQRPSSVDLSAIDSMLADIAAPSVDAARKRRKTGEQAAVAPRPVPAPAAPITEPAPSPVVSREPEPAPSPVVPREPEPEPERFEPSRDAPSEPPETAGEPDDDAPIRFTPGSLVSFMPPPPRESDSLEEDFESVLGGADANGDGETSAPIAALSEDSGVTELGEDAVIAGDLEEEIDGDGDFEVLNEGIPGDAVDELMAEMARSSNEPEAPADLQLLEDEVVSDALDGLFDEASDGDRASALPSADAPDTLPDDAVPPGLVRERPLRQRGAPPPPPDEDAASKKKGFFGKLFGK